MSLVPAALALETFPFLRHLRCLLLTSEASSLQLSRRLTSYCARILRPRFWCLTPHPSTFNIAFLPPRSRSRLLQCYMQWDDLKRKAAAAFQHFKISFVTLDGNPEVIRGKVSQFQQPLLAGAAWMQQPRVLLCRCVPAFLRLRSLWYICLPCLLQPGAQG